MVKRKVCGYTNKKGKEINSCEDMPITYCKKCGTFYVLDEDGNREEVSIKVRKLRLG